MLQSISFGKDCDRQANIHTHGRVGHTQTYTLVEIE